MNGKILTVAWTILLLAGTGSADPTGLIAEYKFDDNVIDTSGNGHDGVILGGITAFVTGKSGDALSFERGGGQVDLGSWTPGTAWTVEAWVKPAAAPEGRHTIAGAAWDCKDWGIVQQYGSFGVSIRQPGGCTQTVSSDVIGEPGTWYYVTGTSDGTTAKIYVNGILKNSGTVEPGYSGNTAPRIAGEFCCDENYFTGTIDEVRIYDHALADTEVLAEYNRFSTSVPEFPTIALPVIAVICLVALFQRRRDN